MNLKLLILISALCLPKVALPYSTIVSIADLTFCESSGRYTNNDEARARYEVDINNDGENELALLFQANNWAFFSLYYQADCGYKQIENLNYTGDALRFLSYASSASCYPVGCHQLTYCEDIDNTRYLVTIIGGHTLTLEQAHEWRIGKIADKDVSSQVTKTYYQLVDGKLVQHEVSSWPDVSKHSHLFSRGDKKEDQYGFKVSSCLLAK